METAMSPYGRYVSVVEMCHIVPSLYGLFGSLAYLTHLILYIFSLFFILAALLCVFIHLNHICTSYAHYSRHLSFLMTNNIRILFSSVASMP